jgi:hypothetical protein
MGRLKDKLRLILWCPHVHWYIGNSVASKVFGQMGSCKYQWMQRLIKDNPDNVFVYCDADYTSVVHYHGDILRDVADLDARKDLCLREARLWSELNGLNIKPENFLCRPDQIQSGDIIFAFSIYFLSRPLPEYPPSSDLIGIFSRSDIFKVVHLTHYVFHLEKIAANLKTFNVNMCCYESNLAKTKFFSRHFPFISEVVTVPFAVQDRFGLFKPFDQRESRCIVTGGISFMKLAELNKEFFFEFSVNNFYPLRVLISENAEMLSSYLAVNTGYYETEMKEAKQDEPFSLERWREIVASPASSLEGIHKTTAYYGKNMVELYNNFRLSYVSEELSYTPALGFFESMACGAVPIGVDSFIYNDIGLVEDRNYLTFDGSLGDLLAVVVQVAKNPDCISHIPAENQALIKRNFTEQAVLKRFISDLEERYEAWVASPAAPKRNA